MKQDKLAGKATDANSVLRKHLSAVQRRKRNRTITIILVIAIVLAAIAGGVLLLRKSVAEKYGSTETDVVSYDVTAKDISTTLSGSGTLVDDDVEDVDVPDTVEIDTVYVEEGDQVAEGDLIATVNIASVVSAMADLQAQIDEIDAELEEVSDEEVDSIIKFSTAGRVKKIFAEEGDDIADVMYTYGSLMLVSLDGLMAVDIETTAALEEGDKVNVTQSDGKVYEGTVEMAGGGAATITVTDNRTIFGDAVEVSDTDGNVLGTGELYIHSELKVTGYAGTVSNVYVIENQNVVKSSRLFYLKNTEYTANYDTLLQERIPLEEDLEELIKLYKEGAVYSPISGIIYSVDYSADEDTQAADTTAMAATDTTAAADTAAADQSASGYTTIVTVSPNATMSVTVSMDESDILSLKEGQEATVTVDSIGDDEFIGTVTEVNTSSTSSGGVTVYAIEVTIDKTEQMLSGMSASVVIVTESVANVLAVPEDAVEQTSTASYVYTAYDEETGELSGAVEVETGLSNGTYIEITSGLTEGETVYYEDTSSDTTNTFGFGNMPSGNMPGGTMPSGGAQGGPGGN